MGLITTENKASQTNQGNNWLTGNEVLLQPLQKAGWNMFPPPPPAAHFEHIVTADVYCRDDLTALASVLPTGWELIFGGLKVQNLTLGSQMEHSIALIIELSCVENSFSFIQVHFQRDCRTKLRNSQTLLVIWTRINMLTLEQIKPAFGISELERS